MNIQMRRQIDQLAGSIQKVYRIDIPIDDMEKVVKTLGGTIEVDSNIIDGKIQKQGNPLKLFLEIMILTRPEIALQLLMN